MIERSSLQASDDFLANLRDGKPVLWTNPSRAADGMPDRFWGDQSIGMPDIEAVADRFRRFSPVLASLFPELRATNGVIESRLYAVPALEHALTLRPSTGRLLLKADHELPVAGSIKARGGIHEVLEFAEKLALDHGLITPDDFTPLATASAKELFGRYQVAVGSTGNLGLSIGVIASALGFRATVHMSADAKQWKKDRLRNRGVSVVEHEGDYAAAVAAGRTAAESDPKCHFVDDEDSLSLFLGYSAAALHLRLQLEENGVVVDREHPLFVYIPCGVGGAPGGIAFGLEQVFGTNVHCFFAEPTASPCFLVSLLDASGGSPSVYDLGLTNQTEADGLAVPRASERAVAVMRPALGGVFTVKDDTLFRHVYTAMVSESLRIEPSAAAAFDGPHWITDSSIGREYLAQHGIEAHIGSATHVLWTTGGLFVPQAEYGKFFDRGMKLAARSRQSHGVSL